jgi:hypothetical protein
VTRRWAFWQVQEKRSRKTASSFFTHQLSCHSLSNAHNFTRDTLSVTSVLVADAEVAANGERLLLDLGLELDLGRTRPLAFDPL